MINDEQLNRLLRTSEKICIEEDSIAELSAKDLEDTPNFKSHIDNLLRLLNNESIILNAVSLKRLHEFQKILYANDKNKDEDVAFNRLSQIVQDKINEHEYEMEEEAIEDEDEDEIEETETEEAETEEKKEEKIPDKVIDQMAIFQNSYMDTGELDKYLIHVIERVSIIVLKKMHRRISNTEALTKSEINYKKNLLKYLREFKYFIFTLDYKLERLGAEYRFNIEAIPCPEETKEDFVPLYHNQCINILDDLYSTETSSTKLSDISKMLYYIMCLEEYLNYLGNDELTTLLSFCKKLEEKSQRVNYGHYGKEKIRKRIYVE